MSMTSMHTAAVLRRRIRRSKYRCHLDSRRAAATMHAHTARQATAARRAVRQRRRLRT